MTVVPLPDVPTVRIRLIWNEGDSDEMGVRLYFKYSGSAPTGANCTTLASDTATAFTGSLQDQIGSSFTLNEIDVLDIATDSGLSGQWTGAIDGALTGNVVPAQCATNVEFDISRRYRGGKPRMYLPPPDYTRLAGPTEYSGTHVSDVNGACNTFFDAIAALSIGSMGTLGHVNLSYYKGFTNITNSSGRERAVPTYRATALHDDIVSYATKLLIGSQRRRRASTTP